MEGCLPAVFVSRAVNGGAGCQRRALPRFGVWRGARWRVCFVSCAALVLALVLQLWLVLWLRCVVSCCVVLCCF